MLRLLLFLFCQPWLVAYSQNLVLNASFEDENRCEGDFPCSPSAWFYTVSGAYAGYMNNGVPGATGNRWLSIAAGSKLSAGERQYWQTILLQPLESGKKYKVGISIHGWDIEPDISDIGFFFARRMKFHASDTLIQPKDFLDFKDAKQKELGAGWLRLEKEYTATGNDQIMFIGNFSSENSQLAARKRGSGSKYIGLLVDDLMVEPVDATDCSLCDLRRDSIYSLTKRHPSAPDVLAAPVSGSIVPDIDTLILRNLNFDFAQHQLKNTEQIDSYRKYFDQNDNEKVIVLGYTDETGDEKYNKDLSQKRADEVVRLIKEKFALADWNFESIGMGVSRSFKADADNRRVEVHFVKKTHN